MDYSTYMEQMIQIESRKAIALEALVATASNILQVLSKTK